MIDPVTAMVATQVIGSLMGARDARRESKHNAALLRKNAAFAHLQALDAQSRGAVSAVASAVKSRSMVGSQRAALAAQGIDIGSGSALDVQVETGALGEIDIMSIRNNAAREAWGYEVQANDFLDRANLTERAGRNRSRTTLLTGGLQVFNTINQNKVG